LGPHPNIQPKQYLDPFSHFCTSRRVFLYFTMCRPFPLKLSLPMGDLDPHLIRAHPSPQLKWHLVRFSRFAELISLLRMWQTDRQTDRPTDRPRRYSVCNNRPHLRTYIVLRCGLQIDTCRGPLIWRKLSALASCNQELESPHSTSNRSFQVFNAKNSTGNQIHKS